MLSRDDLKSKFNIDFDLLETIGKRESSERVHPVVIGYCRTLFIAGYKPKDIINTLGEDVAPVRSTIMKYADEGGWLEERDAFQRKLSDNALKKIEEDQLSVNARHLKALKSAQVVALAAIRSTNVNDVKFGEAANALVNLINTERKVWGISDPENQTNIDARTQTINVNADVPPEKRQEYFDLMRKKFEVDQQISELGKPHESQKTS
jgi:hypothetical protein